MYNIVDDDPSSNAVWFPALAKLIGALAPLRVGEQEAVPHNGADAVYALQLRGASNAKAKKELRFAPRPFEWLGD